jgi:uncharacterized membrane protein
MDTETQHAAPGSMPAAAIASIDAIARLEQEFLKERTVWNRVADEVAAFTGSMAFVIIHLALFAAWFLVNTGKVPVVRPFDPYPFVLLAMAVSCEAVLLSTFVLMKQNRMTARSEQRDQLHLQIALLTEKELTKVLQALKRMSEAQGLNEVAEDAEVRELSENTAVDSLARELKRKLPNEEV